MSRYARGLDALWGMYPWLDRAPKGRNETGPWWRRHDEYEPLPQNAGSCCHTAEAQAWTRATAARQRRGTATTLVGPRRAGAAVMRSPARRNGSVGGERF